jgi:hypothetical protein
VVRGVDAARVVEERRVVLAAGAAKATRAAVGDRQVGALGEHAAAQLVGVDPHGVVGLVADVGVGLLRLFT